MRGSVRRRTFTPSVYSTYFSLFAGIVYPCTCAIVGVPPFRHSVLTGSILYNIGLGLYRRIPGRLLVVSHSRRRRSIMDATVYPTPECIRGRGAGAYREWPAMRS